MRFLGCILYKKYYIKTVLMLVTILGLGFTLQVYSDVLLAATGVTTLEKPKISPKLPAGVHFSGDVLEITISHSNKNVDLDYRLGNVGPIIKYEGPFLITPETPVYARAYLSDGTSSKTALAFFSGEYINVNDAFNLQNSDERGSEFCDATADISHDISSNTYVVWNEIAEGGIYLGKSDDRGVSYKKISRVNKSDFSGTKPNPQLILDKHSNVIVAWKETRNGNDYIHISRSNDGGQKFSEAASIYANVSDSSGADSNYSLALGSGDTLYVLWQNAGGLYISSVSEKGKILNKTLISKNISEIESSFDIDAQGNIHIAWAEDSNVYYSYSNDAGNTFAEKKIIYDSLGHDLKLALDSKGKVFIAWRLIGSPNDKIMLAQTDNSGAFSHKMIPGFSSDILLRETQLALTDFFVDKQNNIYYAVSDYSYKEEASWCYPTDCWGDSIRKRIVLYSSRDGGSTFSRKKFISNKSRAAYSSFGCFPKSLYSQKPFVLNSDVALTVDEIGSVYMAWRDPDHGNLTVSKGVMGEFEHDLKISRFSNNGSQMLDGVVEFSVYPQISTNINQVQLNLPNGRNLDYSPQLKVNEPFKKQYFRSLPEILMNFESGNYSISLQNESSNLQQKIFYRGPASFPDFPLVSFPAYDAEQVPLSPRFQWQGLDVNRLIVKDLSQDTYYIRYVLGLNEFQIPSNILKHDTQYELYLDRHVDGYGSITVVPFTTALP